MVRGLSWGRGYRRGENAHVAQEESFDRRKREIPDQRGWIFTQAMHPLHSTLTDAAATRDSVRLLEIPKLDRDYLLTKAFIGVSAAVAGTVLYAAIYSYESRPEFKIVKVAGAEVQFDTSATGRKEVSLSRRISLLRDEKYFMGTVATGGASDASVSSVGTFSSDLHQLFTLSDSSLPSEVRLDTVTSTYATTTPCVMYISEEAARFF